MGYLAQHQLFDQVHCLLEKFRNESDQIPRLNFIKGILLKWKSVFFGGLFVTPEQFMIDYATDSIDFQ